MTYSASFFEDEEEEILTEDEARKQEKKEKLIMESDSCGFCLDCGWYFYGSSVLSE